MCLLTRIQVRSECEEDLGELLVAGHSGQRTNAEREISNQLAGHQGMHLQNTLLFPFIETKRTEEAELVQFL